MRTLAILVALGGTAAAEPFGGATLTLSPDGSAVQAWAALGWGDYYAGAELAAETYTSGTADRSASYHLFGGARARLAKRIVLLADLGAGVSQQLAGYTDTVGWAPSAAVRAHLVIELATIRCVTLGLAIGGDARVALDGDSMGGGGGLGLVLAR